MGSSGTDMVNAYAWGRKSFKQNPYGSSGTFENLSAGIALITIRYYL